MLGRSRFGQAGEKLREQRRSDPKALRMSGTSAGSHRLCVFDLADEPAL